MNLCSYPCQKCGKPAYYIDLDSPARRHVVRAEACFLLDKTTVPKSNSFIIHECGQRIDFI